MADLSSIIPIDTLTPETAREHGLLGKVPATSCLSDPRFIYYLYAPKTYYNSSQPPPRLLVLIHGSNRNAEPLRQAFQTFAETHNVFLLCPLFPIGFLDPNDTDNYKKVQYRGIRYDRVVLDMIDEVTARYPKLRSDRFGLYGFSGGGQFVHRFGYLHPERLLGLVVGAPGAQTRWDHNKEYPAGVRNFDRVFDGVHDNWEEALRTVPTLFVCGAKDTDLTWMKLRGRPIQEGGRLMAAKRLEESWRAQGARKTRFAEVPHAAHEEEKMWPLARSFFAELLGEPDEQNAAIRDGAYKTMNGWYQKQLGVEVSISPLATAT